MVNVVKELNNIVLSGYSEDFYNEVISMKEFLSLQIQILVFILVIQSNI